MSQEGRNQFEKGRTPHKHQRIRINPQNEDSVWQHTGSFILSSLTLGPITKLIGADLVADPRIAAQRQLSSPSQ